MTPINFIRSTPPRNRYCWITSRDSRNLLVSRWYTAKCLSSSFKSCGCSSRSRDKSADSYAHTRCSSAIHKSARMTASDIRNSNSARSTDIAYRGKLPEPTSFSFFFLARVYRLWKVGDLVTVPSVIAILSFCNWMCTSPSSRNFEIGIRRLCW